MNVTYLGLVAGALTSLATIPQVVRTCRTRHARDISIWQPVLLDVGTGLWLVYGLLIGDAPLIVANSISILFNSTLIYLKIIYGDGDKNLSNDYIGEKMIYTEDI